MLKLLPLLKDLIILLIKVYFTMFWTKRRILIIPLIKKKNSKKIVIKTLIMGIHLLNPCTPGTRNRSVSDFSELTRTKPEKSLTSFKQRSNGRNNRGIITCRHRGGGHKRLYREIDFRRDKIGVPAKVLSVEYDPNRNARIALLHYEDGVKSYILHPRGLNTGDIIISDLNAPILVGNSLPLRNIPLGAEIHNVEFQPGAGGQLARAAGSLVEILAKEGDFVTVRLPSKEIRLISKNSWATLGQVGNVEAYNLTIGKAGRSRWLGIRPTVRGSAMNPVDHPHGGGEGKAPVGHSRPLTPWGRPALGKLTRKPKKFSNVFIIRKRKKKKKKNHNSVLIFYQREEILYFLQVLKFYIYKI